MQPQPSVTMPSESALVAAALHGDDRAFGRLIEPYRRELHVHCYRMLGSLHDAEDALQESLVRAWRGLGTFEERASFRAWLYRVTTNTCLNMVRRRRSNGGTAAEAIHLQPYPDRDLGELKDMADPEARYELRESIELAFIAALQLLSPRQRAALVLKDVLGWDAREIARVLDASLSSVNSALQRARATLRREYPNGRDGAAHLPASAVVERSLVRRFVEAWERSDVEGLVALLTEEATMIMPPALDRYIGRDSIAAFFATVPEGGALDRIRLVEVRANGQPALAAYAPDADTGVDSAYGLMVLAMEGEAIAWIFGFGDPALFPSLGLPAALPQDAPISIPNARANAVGSS